MKRFYGYRLALCLLLLPALAAPATAQRTRSFDYEDVIERTFTVQPGQLLSLNSDLGAVEIVGTGGNEVRVTVVKGVRDMSREQAEDLFRRFDVTFRETSRGVEIGGEYDRPSVTRRRSLQVVYEIEVPRTFSVDVATSGGGITVATLSGEARVKTSGGSIRVADVEGAVSAHTSGGSISAERIGDRASLHTSGGSITVREIEGDARLNTSGGSITAESVRGSLTAETSGGSIRLRNLAGRVEASTSGGSVEADLSDALAGPVRLSTSGGSVSIRVDPRLRADIDAQASGGRVQSDLPITGQVSQGTVRGTLNGGGVRLTLRSSGGSVRIREQ